MYRKAIPMPEAETGGTTLGWLMVFRKTVTLRKDIDSRGAWVRSGWEPSPSDCFFPIRNTPMTQILPTLALAICLVCSPVLAQEPPKQEPPRQGPSKDSPANTGTNAAATARRSSRETRPAASRAAAAECLAAAAAASDKGCLAWHKRAVIRLNHAPAAEVAKALKEMFADDGAVLIVPELVSNALLISAVPGALEEVIRITEGLDRAPAMVVIELLVVQVKPKGDEKADVAKPKAGESATAAGDLDAQLRALEKRGQVEILCRSCLATCSQQTALLKVGRREPRITGSAVNRTGSVNSTVLENVGMTVSATPRVGDDKTITMEIDVDDSRFGPLEEGTPISVSSGGETTRTPRVETVGLHSTVAMRDGQTVLVGGRIVQSKSSRTEMAILVSARVIESKRGK